MKRAPEMSDLSDILVVAHRVPFPPDKGDRIRVFHLLKYLARFATTHLACLADEPVADEALGVLRGICRRVAIVPLGSFRSRRALSSLLRGRSISEGVFHSPQLTEVVRAWSDDTSFNAAIASSSALAPYLAIGRLSKAPAIVDLIDVDSQKWFDYAKTVSFPKSWLYRLEGRRVLKAERNIVASMRGTVVVSEAEADLLRRQLPGAQVTVAANGVDLDYFTPASGESSSCDCVFTGAMDYRPNIDAVIWFANEVWPLVREANPKARFRIVGRNPARAVRQLCARADIEVTGAVADVRPYLHEAVVAVAPLRIARGLQNKVLEALSMRIPVIASPAALNGFRDDVPALKATSPAEWARHIARLFRDAGERRVLGKSGRAFAEAHHDWNRCLTPFRTLLGLNEPPTNEHRELLVAATAGR